MRTALDRLRRDSPIERVVALRLDALGERYARQHPVGPYRADFYLPRLNLVVECDGAAWHGRTRWQVDRDRRRDAFMRGRGLRVVRFTGTRIVRTAGQCLDPVLRVWRVRVRASSAFTEREQGGVVNGRAPLSDEPAP